MAENKEKKFFDLIIKQREHVTNLQINLEEAEDALEIAEKDLEDMEDEYFNGDMKKGAL